VSSRAAARVSSWTKTAPNIGEKADYASKSEKETELDEKEEEREEERAREDDIKRRQNLKLRKGQQRRPPTPLLTPLQHSRVKELAKEGSQGRDSPMGLIHLPNWLVKVLIDN
jgi:hypothetical protein